MGRVGARRDFATHRYRGSGKPRTPSYDQMAIFAEAIAIVQAEYVEEVDTPSLIENALNGALGSL